MIAGREPAAFARQVWFLEAIVAPLQAARFRPLVLIMIVLFFFLGFIPRLGRHHRRP